MTVHFFSCPGWQKSALFSVHSKKVPSHSRLRHFGSQELSEMLQSWKCSEVEKARRLVDLVTVSVLLDAGAGSQWRYSTQGKQAIGSSEGLWIGERERVERERERARREIDR